MSKFYIYSTNYEKKNEHDELLPCSVTVIFCDKDKIEEVNLQSEIKAFYQDNYQTDEIFVIGGEYNLIRLEELFITKQITTFKDIPRLQRDHLNDSLYLFTFNKDGKLICKNNIKLINEDILNKVINDGLIKLFKERGGLIEAKGDAHHFVFPSGKHCNKFLRTGNVLLHSSEIYFIAFNLLSYFKEEEHKQIFCDTSSINTLAFALLELKRKLIGKDFKLTSIESFSSYDGLFSKSVKYFGNSLILISSSTSGNIIDRIVKHDDKVNISNIAILYFLGKENDYSRFKDNIVCNLTQSKANGNGIIYYDTYSEKDCIYCKKGSYPVDVKGDVFLLENPKINRVSIKTTDAPKKLSNFINQFKAYKKIENNVIKVNYKENSKTLNKYEVYFDMHFVLTMIQSKKHKNLYTDFRKKLIDYINQYIPSNVRYIISLPDEGSEKLVDIIIDNIKPNYKNKKLPDKIKFDDLPDYKIDENKSGAIVIVGSCISNGKNLLYLSRSLRPYDNYKLVYFIGLTRTKNEQYSDYLKINLKQGKYGKETNSFVEVENFYCTIDSKNTTWLQELDFLKELLDLIEDEVDMDIAKDFFRKRINLIEDSLSTQVKGLANYLFYPVVSDYSEELHLRKNFAFYNFTSYFDNVSQADVYFTISTVLNSLRYSDNHKQCLKQSEFVRNVIDPFNFNRFNDGIIQGSILRAALNSEMSYHISYDLSNDMKSILEKMIEQHKSPQGEGLLEFLYAISIEKLTLKSSHLFELSKMIDKIEDNQILKAFNLYINRFLLDKKLSLIEQINVLKSENDSLKKLLKEKS